MRTDPDLWERLSKLQLDSPGAAFPFSRRLARDNGWSRAFALRAIEEYKRFAYLATVAGREVTPSDEVDQVWHLHLTYTRHYWGPFTEVLGAPLHHGPTSGGPSEDARFEDNYEATQRLYRAEFGMDPPTDIWPPAAKRFGDASHFRRLNMKNHWRIPKPSLAGALAAAGPLAALTLFATGALADKGGDGPPGMDWIVTATTADWPSWLKTGAMTLGLMLVARFMILRATRERKGGFKNRDDDVCSWYGGSGYGDGDSGGDCGEGGCGGGCGWE